MKVLFFLLSTAAVAEAIWERRSHPATEYDGVSGQRSGYKLQQSTLTSPRALTPIVPNKGFYPFNPAGGWIYGVDNIGRDLQGDVIVQTSDYHDKYLFEIGKDVFCYQSTLVTDQNGIWADDIRHYSSYGKWRMESRIRGDYHINYILDNLNAALKRKDGTYQYYGGIPLGYVNATTDEAYVYNHFNVEIHYSKPSTVLRFAIEPLSIKHKFHLPSGHRSRNRHSGKIVNFTSALDSCHENATQHTSARIVENQAEPQPLSDSNVLCTFDVIWINDSTLEWSDRWNPYLQATNPSMHWNGIFSSFCIMGAVLGCIAVYGSHKIRVMNEATQDPIVVLRPPAHTPRRLAAFAGTGAQILYTVLATIALELSGIINPALRGSIWTTVIVLFAVFGLTGGYVTAKFSHIFEGTGMSWSVTRFIFYFPLFLLLSAGLFLACCDQVNDTYFPSFGAFLIPLFWFLLVPLAYIGVCYFSCRNRATVPTCAVGDPDELPQAQQQQPWHCHQWLHFVIAGIPPFGCCVTELSFVMDSWWKGPNYYGSTVYLLLVLMTTLTTSAGISAILCQWQFENGNFGWWWRSFTNGGALAVPIFLYSIVYFHMIGATRRWETLLIYFEFMMLFCVTVFITGGYAGVAFTFWFNKMLYGNAQDEAEEGGVYTRLEPGDDEDDEGREAEEDEEDGGVREEVEGVDDGEEHTQIY